MCCEGLVLAAAASLAASLALRLTSALALGLVEDELSKIGSTHLLSTLCRKGGRRCGRSISGLVSRGIGGLVSRGIGGLVGGLVSRCGRHLAAATPTRCRKRAGHKLNSFLNCSNQSVHSTIPKDY